MRSASVFAPVVDLIYPPRCPLCGGGLAAHGGLCAGCWGGLALPGEPACALCQAPLPAHARAGDACADCAATPPRHAGITAATLYNDTAREMVLALKYARRLALAPVMARMMAMRLNSGGLGALDESWLLVPVPLHSWRLWRRGFNQSALLARELSRTTGARLAVDGLRRLRRTPPLAGLGREQRAAVMDGAIGVNAARMSTLAGARVMLIDDVLTSGATSNACVAALEAAGVHSVAIGCFARVSWGLGDDGMALR